VPINHGGGTQDKHYDPAKEAAKPQWKKAKNPKVKKATHIYFISSSDEEEPEPPVAGSSSGAHGGPVHTYFTDSN
jgi:hypothetical protein